MRRSRHASIKRQWRPSSCSSRQRGPALAPVRLEGRATPPLFRTPTSSAASSSAQGVVTLPVQRLTPAAILPRYGRPGDAGLDLFSAESYDLSPGERRAFSTGIALAVPIGFVGLVWDRSGLAVRAGITTLGGVIDATYRGEVKVPLLNTGAQLYAIRVGDRIGQLLIQPIPIIEVSEAEALDDTPRGAAGFGSSGR